MPKYTQDPKTGKLTGSIGAGKSHTPKPSLLTASIIEVPQKSELVPLKEKYRIHKQRTEYEAYKHIEAGKLERMFNEASKEIDWDKISTPEEAKEVAKLIFQTTIPQTVQYIRRDIRNQILSCRCTGMDHYGNQEQAQDCPQHGDLAAEYLSEYAARIADPDGTIAEALAGKPLEGPWEQSSMSSHDPGTPF